MPPVEGRLVDCTTYLGLHSYCQACKSSGEPQELSPIGNPNNPVLRGYPQAKQILTGFKTDFIDKNGNKLANTHRKILLN